MFNLIEECKQTIIKATDLMDKICEQGINEGLKHKEIQEIIFAVFKDAYSERHIRRLMPKDIKNQNMVRNFRMTPLVKVEQWNNSSSVNDLMTVVEPHHNTRLNL